MTRKPDRMKPEDRAKVDAAKESNRVKRWNYIEDINGIRRGVRCKVTGKFIRVLGDSGVRTEDGYALGVVKTLPNYREIEITMEDGSKHVSGVDDGVANRLSLEHLKDIYLADIDRLHEIDKDDRLDIDWFMSRTPKSYRVIGK